MEVSFRPCRLCECPAADGGVPRCNLSLEGLSRLWSAHHQHKTCNSCHFCLLDFSRADEASGKMEQRRPENAAAIKINQDGAEKSPPAKIDADFNLKHVDISLLIKQEPPEEEEMEPEQDVAPSDALESYFEWICSTQSDDISEAPENSAAPQTQNSDSSESGQKPWKRCIYCPKFFYDQINLQQHVARAHSDVENKRKISKISKNETERRKHHQENHERSSKDRVRCPFCEGKFATARIQSHFECAHSKEKVSKCAFPGCRDFFKSERDKSAHVKAKHFFETDPQCVYCGMFILKKNYMLYHVQSWHQDVAIRCRTCCTFFKTLEDRQKHVKEVHQKAQIEIVDLTSDDEMNQSTVDDLQKEDEESVQEQLRLTFFKCLSCPKVFLSDRGLKMHFRQVHQMKDKYGRFRKKKKGLF